METRWEVKIQVLGFWRHCDPEIIYSWNGVTPKNILIFFKNRCEILKSRNIARSLCYFL
jgi:hypothetical protein